MSLILTCLEEYLNACMCRSVAECLCFAPVVLLLVHKLVWLSSCRDPELRLSLGWMFCLQCNVAVLDAVKYE